MISKTEAHESYLRLTDIRAQLESFDATHDGPDVDELISEQTAIRQLLADNGYDPDSEPESIWPENQTSERKTIDVPGYEIYAYDKDNDRLDLILDIRGYTVYNSVLPRHILQSLAALAKNEQLLAPDGQPYDWLELHYNNKRIAVC